MNHTHEAVMIGDVVVPSSPSTREPQQDDEQLTSYTLDDIIIICVLVVAVIIIIVVGNSIVVGLVVINRRLRPVQNLFIASLAVSDLLVGLLVMPLSLANELMGYWCFGNALCELWLAIDVLLCTASILNLCLISVDRYLCITRAVTYPRWRDKRRALIMIGVVWVLAMVICFPPLAGWKRPQPRRHGRPLCVLSSEVGYVVYSTLGSFFIPLIVMMAVYARIYRAARRQARRRLSVRYDAAAAAAAPTSAGPRRDEICRIIRHSDDHDVTAPAPGTEEEDVDEEEEEDDFEELEMDLMVYQPPEEEDEEEEEEDGVQHGEGTVGTDERIASSTRNTATYDDDAAGVLREGGQEDRENGCSRERRDQPGESTLSEETEAQTTTGGALISPERSPHPRLPRSPGRVLSGCQTGDDVPLPMRLHGRTAAPGGKLINYRAPPGATCPHVSSLQQTSAPAMAADAFTEVESLPIGQGNDHRCVSVAEDSSIGGSTGGPAPNDKPAARSTVVLHLFRRSGRPPSFQLLACCVPARHRKGYRKRKPSTTEANATSTSSTALLEQKLATPEKHHDNRKWRIARARERRLTLILGIIMAAFVLCWFPFFSTYLVSSVTGLPVPKTVFDVFFWAGYCNSALNPVIYTIFNRDIRLCKTRGP